MSSSSIGKLLKLRILIVFLTNYCMLLCFHIAVEGAVNFSFNASPNVTVLQSAVYNCSVDDVAVTIQWQVNGTPSTSDEIASLGIVTVDPATPNSSLVFPNANQSMMTINESVITCIAAGLINGQQYFNSSSSTLYIQGKPDGPADLNCQVDYPTAFYTIDCAWKDPFLIEGLRITKYMIRIISIGNFADDYNSDIMQTGSSALKYNVSAYGTYHVDVIPFVEDLAGDEGSSDLLTIKNDRAHVAQTSVLFDKQGDRWVLNLMLNDSTYVKPHPIGLKSCVVQDAKVIVQDSLCSEDFLMGSITKIDYPWLEGQVLLKSNRKWTLEIFLVYLSGIEVPLNRNVVINTFDVQNGTFVVDSVNSKICFTCEFVQGTNSRGCFVEYYNAEDMSIPLGNATINVTDKTYRGTSCVNTSDQLLYDSITVLFYDIEANGSVNKSEIAYQLLDYNLTMETPVDSDTDGLVSINLLPTTATPTVSPTLTSSDDHHNTLLPLVSLLPVIAIASVLVAISISYYLYRKRRTATMKVVV